MKDPGEKLKSLSLMDLFLFYNLLNSFKSFSRDLALEAVEIEIERNEK